MRHLAAAVILPAVLAGLAIAQDQPTNGMREAELRTHAIVGGRVVIGPGRVLEQATVVIEDGVIAAVGPEVRVPPEARVWDAEGLTVYPGFIETAVLVEPGERKAGPGAHWNEMVRAELRMADQNGVPDATRAGLRKLGFTAAAVYPDKGIIRGAGTVIALSDAGPRETTYRAEAAMAMSFDRAGGWGNPTYPGSLMGAIALVRQTFLDAQWHAQARRVYGKHPEGNEPPSPADSLVALEPVLAGRQRVLFDVASEADALRAARLATEFALDYVLLGGGTEFRRLEQIAALGVPVLVPLSFPERPDVSSLARADGVSLRDLMTWEQAPTNPRRLHDAGVTIALTTHRLPSADKFPDALRTAVRHGLTEDAALAALTTTPAALLGLDGVMGTIEPGKIANVVVMKGSLFEKESEVRDTWIDGRRFEIKGAPDATVAFKGTLRTDDGRALTVELDTSKSSASFALPDEDRPAKAKKVTVLRDQLAIVVDGRPFDAEGYVRLSGTVVDERTVIGTGALPGGARFAFTLAADATLEPKGDESDETPEGRGADGEGRRDDGLSGAWTLTVSVPDMPAPLDVPLAVTLGEDGRTFAGTMNVMGQEIAFSEGTFDAETGAIDFSFTAPDGNRMNATGHVDGPSISGSIEGQTIAAEYDGQRRDVAERSPRDRAGGGGRGRKEAEFIMPPEELIVPLGAYGLRAPPAAENVLVRGATIWTCGPAGILADADLLVVDGKVRAIGPDLAVPADLGDAVRIIDADGRHVTPGLIDCHSHTGIDGGVNEFAQANTAEVRIGDCIDPDDVNWYRQLAGGLTACNQLHGSANPIGGQNSVVKLKWGGTADDFRVADAIAGIKFALGENVKRSQSRYPNTRMGVETFIRDAFEAAEGYEAQWQRYESLSTEARARTMPPRRDLELEALVEILRGRRLVHCHSYRQDEILMLIRVADEFGFTIGTFQHVLEGFKVADAIAAHGAGASSFSDWWAYKVEVMDAIPHNGTIMTRVGVNVSFNSDSSELARRMNTEAAKAVRYGGLDRHEALKLVTINPAWQLRIHDRTGSLEEGKDADFVIWSEDPLSTYARCEQTWIEGARYFDLETDRQLREVVRTERERLIQRVLADAHGDAPDVATSAEAAPDAPDAEPTGAWAGLTPAARAWIEQRLRAGEDPAEMRPGDCGCGTYHQLLQGRH